MRKAIEIPAHLLDLPAAKLAEMFGCSRQYIGKLKRKAAGKCWECNRPATIGLQCARHAKERRKDARRRLNLKPWKPGKRGRPPIDRKEPPESYAA